MTSIWSIARTLWRDAWWSGLATGVICFVLALLFQWALHWSTVIAMSAGGLFCLPVGIALRLWQDRIEVRSAMIAYVKHHDTDTIHVYDVGAMHRSIDFTNDGHDYHIEIIPLMDNKGDEQ